MKSIKKVSWLRKWFWPIIAIGIFIMSCFPGLVKWVYTRHLFQWMTFGLRKLTSLFPNAIGEWLYFILIIILIYSTVSFLFKLKDHYNQPHFFQNTLFRVSRKLSLIYILFELFWGLNYHQSSLAQDFKMQIPLTYTESQMDSMSLSLISQLNKTRLVISDRELKKLTVDQLRNMSIQHYSTISIPFPFLTYVQPNIKWAQFPRLGDYIGYLAFYQPLTAEAIIRSDIPKLTLPFTICHEMAHQLGFASEAEANFIAYVVACESKDPIFLYAMQLQLFTYSQIAQLKMIARAGDFKKWEKVIKRNKSLLSPKVLEDRAAIRQFFNEKQNQRIPGFDKLYDQFLIWNKQTKGIETYDDVLLWAIAYAQKQP